MGKVFHCGGRLMYLGLSELPFDIADEQKLVIEHWQKADVDSIAGAGETSPKGRFRRRSGNAK